MAIIKFNKGELVNRSYSLKREILMANRTGAYCNTSIVFCNTRRYHGLLAVPVDEFQGRQYLLLSSLDETIGMNGKYFNLGIHCYGDVYEPRGHKYVVDFEDDTVPQITYKVGQIVLRKSAVLENGSDRILIRYELIDAPSPITLQLKPFLAFREVHALTEENQSACTDARAVKGGVAFKMYGGFPDLVLQMSDPEAEYHHFPVWYKGVTYSDEYRRGFACKEDLLQPGHFEARMEKGDSIVFCASIAEVAPTAIKRRFTMAVKEAGTVTDYHGQLCRCAAQLIRNRGGRKQITAGFSWLYTGLLRETLFSLPGLTLYSGAGTDKFEEILDNLISVEQERLYHRTTQVESPLYLACVLQQYIDFGADPKAVWEKYGSVMKGILESYLPGRRKEVTMHPNGLLWAQADSVALSWMNAYIEGCPVTERAGYQVETNAFWYDAICFSIEMEERYGADVAFLGTWRAIRNLVKDNYQKTFWNPTYRYLADCVGPDGQNLEARPNQLFAISVKHSPVDDEATHYILRVIENELLTSRGIRSLSPRDVKYKGVYEGTQIERDLAYHQGCAYPFLLQPYVSVCFRLRGPSFIKKAEWLTEGFYADLNKHGVGHFSELYDGDPPHEAHGAISSALSTAALLAVDYMLKKYRI